MRKPDRRRLQVDWRAGRTSIGAQHVAKVEESNRLEDLGFAVCGSSAEGLRAMTRDQLAKYARVMKEMGIASE